MEKTTTKYSLAHFLTIKKDKTPVRAVLRWLNGKEYSEVELAKYLSSFQTHCLIDIEQSGEVEKINDYKLVEVSEIYFDFIKGKVTPADARERFKALLKEE